MIVTPRFNYIKIHHEIKSSTGIVVKEWDTYITFFSFFTDPNQIN